MKIIKAHTEILSPLDGEAILRHIEVCGRVCYKSEEKITPQSAQKFVADIIKRGHESVLEHASVTVRFVCDRGVSHEIVRHRLASYSQESTRYCNYGNSGGCVFIAPCFWEDFSDHGAYPSPNDRNYNAWLDSLHAAEKTYLALLENGATPQEARAVLPNSLKTEVVMTANLREWRHFFRLRTAPAAHPQMREVAIPLFVEFKRRIPVVFDDINA